MPKTLKVNCADPDQTKFPACYSVRQASNIYLGPESDQVFEILEH